MGFPFLTGFYSKELILEFAYSRYIVTSNFIYILGVLASVFTVIYSVRLIFFVFSFSRELNTSRIIYYFFKDNDVETSIGMRNSMSFLFIASIVSGYLFSDLFVGLGQNF